jgi:hypothetical protein
MHMTKQNYAMRRTLCKTLDNPENEPVSTPKLLFVTRKPLLRLIAPLLLLLLPLHPINNLTHRAEKLTKPKAPPLNPNAPNEKVHQRPVTDAEREEDAKIAPLIARLDIERG